MIIKEAMKKPHRFKGGSSLPTGYPTLFQNDNHHK